MAFVWDFLFLLGLVWLNHSFIVVSQLVLCRFGALVIWETIPTGQYDCCHTVAYT